MSTFVFALIVLTAAALYFMKPEDRKRLLQAAVARIRKAIHDARENREPHDEFHALLLTRTGRLIVTPALITLMVLITMASGFGNTAGMIAWGANYAPATTNNEWTRLVGYIFVHGGLFHLLATIVALLPLGMILERLVGRIAFAGVFFAAGIVAGTVSLWSASATIVTVGASGAVFGLIGLLLAVLVYGYARPPRLPISGLAARRLAVGLSIFVLFNLASDDLGTVAEMSGLATGIVAGFVIARNITEAKPAALRSVFVAVPVCLVAFLVAMPLRGTIDARPAIARIADVESQTAAEYAKAVERFTIGRMSAKALADVIQRKILPALEADRTRITALHGVPAEQTPLVTTARQYFELREASWRRRIEGLQGSNMKILRDAEQTERNALAALDQLQHLLGTPSPDAAPAVSGA